MKILAIASAGGHWIQLLRLTPAFEGHDLSFISTKASFDSTVQGSRFYYVQDANRWNKWRLFITFYQILKIVIRINPDVVITTGAAPGLMGILAGKICRSKTIWVDSIANVEELSMSGKLSSIIADRVYTQWPDLADGKVIFKGNVLG